MTESFLETRCVEADSSIIHFPYLLPVKRMRFQLVAAMVYGCISLL